MQEISFINDNYMKVLDLISEGFKSEKEIKKKYKKVLKLIFGSEEEINLDAFNVYWASLPETAFNFTNLNELNESLRKFIIYIAEVEDEFKDYGYSLLVSYYLKICEIGISKFCIY